MIPCIIEAVPEAGTKIMAALISWTGFPYLSTEACHS